MKTTVATHIDIAGIADKNAVFRQVCALEEYPEFMPDVRRVKILERGLDTGASAWDIEIDGCPLHWVERDFFDLDSRVFEFRSIEGDFDHFAGRWEVSSLPTGGTRVTFTVTYEVGIPVIEDIIGPVLRVKIEKNSLDMLRSLKETVESLPLSMPLERRVAV
jgi:coenzyme Q-binding protein COQ10